MNQASKRDWVDIETVYHAFADAELIDCLALKIFKALGGRPYRRPPTLYEIDRQSRRVEWPSWIIQKEEFFTIAKRVKDRRNALAHPSLSFYKPQDPEMIRIKRLIS
jgi:hypothetical protein